MAQEVNTLATNNSASSGFFGSLFSGLANLVVSAAPVAANVYQLKLQSQTLQNQSAADLAKIQAQQATLAAQAKTTTASGLPAWLPYAAGLTLVLVLVLVLIRGRSR